MWVRPQECLAQMVCRHLSQIPFTGHTMKPLEQQSNPPWLLRKSVLGVIPAPDRIFISILTCEQFKFVFIDY